MYKCPICQTALEKKAHSFTCLNQHSFDISKEGYVNLLVKNSLNHGDNKLMVQARTNFLNKNYYQHLLERLCEVIEKYPHATILDLGCGEGYYTAKLQKHFDASTIKGIDISKEAIKYAAKQNKQVDYLIGSNAAIPILDKSIDVCICLFSFIDFNEVKRVLKADGILIVVSPHTHHLFELKTILYANPYLNKLDLKEQQALSLINEIKVDFSFHLDNNLAIKELFQMTPYAYKTSKEDKMKLESLTNLDLRASFQVLVYQNC